MYVCHPEFRLKCRQFFSDQFDRLAAVVGNSAVVSVVADRIRSVFLSLLMRENIVYNNTNNEANHDWKQIIKSHV